MVVSRTVLALLLSSDIFTPIATSNDCFETDGLSPFHLLRLQLESRTLVQLAILPLSASAEVECPVLYSLSRELRALLGSAISHIRLMGPALGVPKMAPSTMVSF